MDGGKPKLFTVRNKLTRINAISNGEKIEKPPKNPNAANISVFNKKSMLNFGSFHEMKL